MGISLLCSCPIDVRDYIRMPGDLCTSHTGEDAIAGPREYDDLNYLQRDTQRARMQIDGASTDTNCRYIDLPINDIMSTTPNMTVPNAREMPECCYCEHEMAPNTARRGGILKPSCYGCDMGTGHDPRGSEYPGLQMPEIHAGRRREDLIGIVLDLCTRRYEAAHGEANSWSPPGVHVSTNSITIEGTCELLTERDALIDGMHPQVNSIRYFADGCGVLHGVGLPNGMSLQTDTVDDGYGCLPDAHVGDQNNGSLARNSDRGCTSPMYALYIASFREKEYMSTPSTIFVVSVRSSLYDTPSIETTYEEENLFDAQSGGSLYSNPQGPHAAMIRLVVCNRPQGTILDVDRNTDHHVIVALGMASGIQASARPVRDTPSFDHAMLQTISVDLRKPVT